MFVLLKLRPGALQIFAIVLGIAVMQYYLFRAIGFYRWVRRYTSKLNMIFRIILVGLLLTAYSMILKTINIEELFKLKTIIIIFADAFLSFSITLFIDDKNDDKWN